MGEVASFAMIDEILGGSSSSPTKKGKKAMARKAMAQLRKALAEEDDDGAVDALQLALDDLTTDFEEDGE